MCNDWDKMAAEVAAMRKRINELEKQCAFLNNVVTLREGQLARLEEEKRNANR